MRRVVREQIRGAVQDLSRTGAERHEGVHEARKRFNMIRAALRLGSQGQIVGGDRRALGQEGRALDHVGQLAHVARPPVGHEPIPRVGGEGLGRERVVRADASEEVLGEE